MSDQPQPEPSDPQSGAPTGPPVPNEAPPQAAPPPQVVPQVVPPVPQYAPPVPRYAPPQAAPGYAPPQLPVPPHPAPVRRGLPVGAWIGIGAGALVILLTVVVGVLFVAGALGAKPRSTVSGPTPSASPSPSPSETAPGESGSGSGNSLDSRVDFAAGPFWAVKIDSGNGWKTEVLDQQGYNKLANPPTGCALLTFQGTGDPSASTANDRAATDDTIAAALKIGLPWTGATASPDVRKDSTVSVPIVGGGSIEMLRLTTTYEAKDGERQRTILLRAFTPGNGVLMAQADCPSWAMQTTGLPALEGLSVTDQ